MMTPGVSPEPRVVSVNVGGVRTVDWHGRRVTTAIWKTPAAGRVTVDGVNLVGDDQADRRVHGGTDKAVYAYSIEDYAWWSATIGPVGPATFGENLTTAGIELNDCHIGDRWVVGSSVLEVAQPRMPCFKLGIRMEDDAFPARFEAAGRPGVYLRIVEPGDLGTDDAIGITAAERPAVRVGSLIGDQIDEAVLRLAAADPRVPEVWRRVATRALAK
jgi:MOSC domain-containing protein YiiM